MPLSAFIVFLAWPAWALRLVTTSPQTTEMVFEMGLGSSVVGVSEASAYPPEAAALPNVGRLFTPNVEKTVLLRPDLVVLDSHNLNPPYAHSLEALGIPTFLWDTHSPESLLDSAEKFAARTGAKSRAVENLRPHLQRCPPRDDRFLLFVWMDPPILSGERAFLSQLLTGRGFSPISLGHTYGDYVTVSEEWLLQQQPNTVFFLQHQSENRERILQRFQHWWPRHRIRFRALDAENHARAAFSTLRQFPPECKP